MDLKRINEHVSVSGQIQPGDIAALKEAGFTAIINNRPDDESPDQPASAEIEAAAKAAGLDYYAIPLGREGVSPDMVEKTKSVLEGRHWGRRSRTTPRLPRHREMRAFVYCMA